MTRLARRLRALTASVLAFSLILLSPGLEAPRLFAQVVGRAAPVEGVHPVPVLTGGAPTALPTAPALMTAPTMSAPSAFMGAPIAAPAAAVPSAAAPALPSARAAASVPEMAKALAAPLAAASKPETSASGAAAAGRDIDAILRGEKSAGSGDVADSVSGAEGTGAPALGLSAAASAPEVPKTGVPAAAAPAEGKVVASRASYRLHRFLLKTVAALTGAVHSLPIAGPALSAKVVASAADKRVVLSDYDDTLAGYNQVLPEDMVAAIKAIRAQGKDFAVISDRGDEKRAHQLTVFESLASLPADVRAGMYVAANSGGRVYRYDASGEPVRVFEVPALDEAAKAKVAQAAEATKARLAEAGTEMHVPSATNNNPSESWGTYGYALMLKVGSSKESVVEAAGILQDELKSRGLDVEVSPRFAKDPANPPYINFSIVTKAPASEFIAKALKAEAKDVVILGDNHYAPVRAKKDSWLSRLGTKLSGREMPLVGNRTDANMERGVPGALTLSVGGTGDPRASNLWVLSGKGPATTLKVLESVASKSRAASKPKDHEGAIAALGAAAIIAATAAAYWFLAHAFAEWVAAGEQLLREHARQFVEDGMLLGGVLGSWRLGRAKPGDDKASRYAALEAGYKARFEAVDGVASAEVEDHDFYYGGNLNDTEGKRINVYFKDVASFEKARGGLPAELPALEGVKDVARYEVVPLVEPKALKAAYAALEAGYARRLGEISGVVSVKAADNDFYYGGNLNDTDGKLLEVVFDGVASFQAGRSFLPESLPAIDGVKDVARYKVQAAIAQPRRPWYEYALPIALFAVVAGAFGFAASGAAGTLGYGASRRLLPNPADAYSEARKKAVEAAAARGAAAGSVRFVEATASMPVEDGAQWKYAFEIPGKDGGAALVYVDFSSFLGGAPETRVSVYEGAKASSDRLAKALEPYYFGRGAQLTAETALDLARKAGPALGARASVALDYRKDAATGDEDLWYRFHDDKGGVASVNARTGEARVETLSALSLKGLASGTSIDGFNGYVYETALDEAKRLAAAAGRSPEKLFATGASLAPRAWGEDWTYHFVSARENDFEGPRAYAVTVRRTLVTETQVDAIKSRDLGPIRLFAGIPAAKFAAAVSVAPKGVVDASGDEARTLDVQVRWPADGGPSRVWYVVRGEKGRELYAIDALTGAKVVPAPYAWVKDALIWLGMAAATVGIYVAIWWAISHAGAAASSNPVPFPSDGGIEKLFGGVLGSGLIAGVVGKAKGAKAAKVADDEVRAAAGSVASYKGMPWSQTEYNSVYYPALEGLKAKGATRAQLALFEKLCAEAPLRGGRFNPWSGD